MLLTEEEKQEALQKLMYSKLTKEEKAYHKFAKKIITAKKKAQKALDDMRTNCPHPLVMRKTENGGYSGNWDREEYYWTRHECSMCGLIWNTDQSWQYEGDGKGLPEKK